MANRIGNKIWKEKSRRGMSRKRFWTKKLFYKAGKRNICRRNRIALHVQHASIIALAFTVLDSNQTEKHLCNFSIKTSRGVISMWSTFLNSSDYLSLSDGWWQFWHGVSWFFHNRIFTASYAELKMAQSKLHFMVKLCCKKQDPYLKKKNS